MIKESFLEMAERHTAGDMLAQREWQTCSVGCFNLDYGNDPDDFGALARSTGYEEWTHHVQEAVFEGLPEDDAINWHVQFADKMLTVKNFEVFYHSFMIGVLKIVLPHDKHGVVQPVIDLHKDYKNVTLDAWEKAEDAARAVRAAAADFVAKTQVDTLALAEVAVRAADRAAAADLDVIAEVEARADAAEARAWGVRAAVGAAALVGNGGGIQARANA